jgi:hypothetical protein
MLVSRRQLLPPSKFPPDTASPARRQRDRYVLDRLSRSSSPVSESTSISDSHAWTAETTASFSATAGPYSNSGRHQWCGECAPGAVTMTWAQPKFG